MSDDIIKRLREAIAAGPTPGPWTVMPANAGEQCVARINAWESVPPNGVELAHDTIDAAYIAACHPAAIRELLAEIDRLRADAERYRWLRENLGKWRIETYQTPVQSMVELHILGDSFFYNGDDLDRIIDGQRRDAAMGLTRPAEES